MTYPFPFADQLDLLETDIMSLEEALARADERIAESAAALKETLAAAQLPEPPPAPAPAPAPASDPVQITAISHEVPSVPDPLLVRILSTPRTHDSIYEYQFCKWLREQIATYGYTPTVLDKGLGSIMCVVPREVGKHVTPSQAKQIRPDVLFSCHVDTQDGRITPPKDAASNWAPVKKLAYDDNFGHLFLDKDSIGGCLGSDDGVGVWIMLRMIEAKVPGVYMFHRGEECGGLGAKAVRAAYKGELEMCTMAVAFDRPGTDEVITHQRQQECASDKFGNALAAALNKYGFDYKLSRKGIYTDVADYRDVIAECVNLGVGYTGHHTVKEQLDYAHANALLHACLNIDWESLPIERDPKKANVYHSDGYGGYYGRGWNEYTEAAWTKHRSEWEARNRVTQGNVHPMGGKKKKNKGHAAPAPAPKSLDPQLTIEQELAGMSAEDLEIYVSDNPEDGVKLIISLLLELRKVRAERDTYRDLMPQHLLC